MIYPGTARCLNNHSHFDAGSLENATLWVWSASRRFFDSAPEWVRPPFAACVNSGLDTLVYFQAAARALAGAGNRREAGARAGALTATALADALEQHALAYGANGTNLLEFAPGGGVETVGLAAALNDMLVQSDGKHIHLFPAWPAGEPASFADLRVKGAFLVSAEWEGGVGRVRIASDGDSREVGLAGLEEGVAVRVRCDGGAEEVVTVEGGKVKWRVRKGMACEVAIAKK